MRVHRYEEPDFDKKPQRIYGLLKQLACERESRKARGQTIFLPSDFSITSSCDALLATALCVFLISFAIGCASVPIDKKINFGLSSFVDPEKIENIPLAPRH